MSLFSPDAIMAAKKHARAEYPKEACGLIVAGKYVRCENIAEDPGQDFEISGAVYKKHLLTGSLEAIVHSHPDGPLYPSQTDMEAQLLTDLPWMIIPLDDERTGEPTIWGDDVPIPPIVGRKFMHGVTDCYSLIRDVYRLGRDALKAQDIDWPYPPITLPEFAREDNWWTGESNFYEEKPQLIGFVEIPVEKAAPGDVFLVKIRSRKFNHGGVLLGNDLIAHHLPMRLSRREPASLWGRQAGRWLRFEGSADA